MNTETTQQLTDFFSQFVPFTHKTGERLISAQEEITHIYFIQTGKVRMYSISEDGAEVTLNLFSTGSYFPIMIPMSGKPNSYYFDVLEPITGFRAPVEKVMSYIKSEPELLFELSTNFARAILGLTHRIETLATENAYERVAHLILYLAEKQDSSKKGLTAITVSTSHEDIAAWLGLQRETVSRQIELMQKRGLLVVQNKRIVIPDLSQLKNLS